VHAWPAILDALVDRAVAKDEEVVRVLAGLLPSVDWQVRTAAKQALLRYAWRGHEATLQQTSVHLSHPLPGVRQLAAEVLAVVAPRGHAATVQALAALVHDHDIEVARVSTRSLIAVAQPGDDTALDSLVSSNKKDILAEVAGALAHISGRGDARVVARLLEILDEARWWVRLAALRALAFVASPEEKNQRVLHFLERGEEARWYVRQEEALQLIGVGAPVAADDEPLDPEDICMRAAALQALCEELASRDKEIKP